MIKNQNSKLKAVGRGMMKVANQNSGSSVRAEYSWGSGGGSPKGGDGAKGGGVKTRGNGAATRGVRARGPMGAPPMRPLGTKSIGSKQK